MTTPTDPAAYEWPAIDVSQHVEAVKSAAAIFASSIRVIRLPEEYDDSYLPRDTSFVDMGYVVQPVRFMAGMDQAEADFDPEFARVKWGEPVTLSLDLAHVAQETIDILFGLDVRVPLCEQQIPAKGQE